MTLASTAPLHPASLAARTASAEAHERAAVVLRARNPEAAERHEARALVFRRLVG